MDWPQQVVHLYAPYEGSLKRTFEQVRESAKKSEFWKVVAELLK